MFTTPEGYFNGSDTLTRAEFLTGVYKAHNPVTTLEANVELKSDEYNPFVNQMLPYSFTDMKNETNYTGVMTRGEAIHTLVKMYYANETTDGETKHFVDTVNGGEISLSDALQNPDAGMPSAIYEAIVIAESHGIIDGAESRWDEGITKKEALDMITRVYSEANLANSVEFETSVSDNTANSDNTADVGTTQENNGRLHINNVNGEIRYSSELKDAINSSLDRQGLARSYGKNILSDYYNQVKDKDNSKIYTDTIDNLTASLKADIKEAERQQQAQQNQNNNNNGGSSNVEVDDDGYVYEDNNEYPSGNVNQDDGDYIPPDTPDITEGSTGGSLADKTIQDSESAGEWGDNPVDVNP